MIHFCVDISSRNKQNDRAVERHESAARIGGKPRQQITVGICQKRGRKTVIPTIQYSCFTFILVNVGLYWLRRYESGKSRYSIQCFWRVVTTTDIIVRRRVNRLIAFQLQIVRMFFHSPIVVLSMIFRLCLRTIPCATVRIRHQKMRSIQAAGI